MRKTLALAFAGLLTAILVDLDAWRKYPSNGGKVKFSIKTAAKRWVIGFVSGFVTGLSTYGSE